MTTSMPLEKRQILQFQMGHAQVGIELRLVLASLCPAVACTCTFFRIQVGHHSNQIAVAFNFPFWACFHKVFISGFVFLSADILYSWCI